MSMLRKQLPSYLTSPLNLALWFFVFDSFVYFSTGPSLRWCLRDKGDGVMFGSFCKRRLPV